MGRIAGIQIKNYGSLKNIKLGKLLGDNSGRELTNMNAIIGQSGTGKSTLADAFGFLADCMEKGVETACDLNTIAADMPAAVAAAPPLRAPIKPCSRAPEIAPLLRV